MAKRAGADLSLSLVDVVTNGLASVLVLFFLLTMLRSHVTWKSTLSETRGDATQAIDPLLIVVTGLANDKLEQADLFPAEQSPWSKEFTGNGFALSHGRSYATFFADNAPQLPQQVVLTLPADHPGYQVQVLHGKQRIAWSIARSVGGDEVLWPVPKLHAPAEEQLTEGLP